ncbi:MAG: hypothetical protein NW200_02780 [Hyphomonadaceae bacterium]|nr:hypothetical protein [Hyphomonadaceae bacterium]
MTRGLGRGSTPLAGPKSAMRRLWRLAAATLAIAACGAPAPGAGEAREANAAVAGSLFAARPDVRRSLPGGVSEVSGLAATADGRLLAHDDERAIVREISLETGAFVKSFAIGAPIEKGDFEGIAVAPGGDVYLTTSAGRLYRFREGENGAQVPFTVVETGLAPLCEVEGLAYHAASDSLIFACKEMLARGRRDEVALYAWSRRDGRLSTTPWRGGPMARFATAAGVEGFHPSSVDIDPATGRIVLLAARERAMVELAPDGAVLSGRRLGGGHPQAEGAAIMPDGALVIADEAPKKVSAQIARYPRQND